MISLTTFRGTGEVIVTNPSSRTDGDTTTWQYHDTTGLELQKTYADSSSEMKRYGAFNNCTSITDARGVVKTNAYDRPRGLLLRTTYSDGTTTRAYTYNHLGQLTQVTDAAGTRTLVYNAYGELESDVLVAGGVTHTITEQRDELGRNTGYTYAKNGVIQQTVTTGYAADSRIATAGFGHEGKMKQFTYTYLPGTNLLHRLTHPNGITFTQGYEAKRDLLTDMLYTQGETTMAQRSYTYDAIGRPTLRKTRRSNEAQDDTFAYNNRSELVAASLGDKGYAYTYDNIGNRESAQEAAEEVTQYESNALNQYTAVGDFIPEFDSAGNQTLVKTSTGIWQVSYNAENRPIRFESENGSTVVQCGYDYMGRRNYKKVTTNGTVTLHQRYIYRGYLQIAACDLTRAATPCLWLLLWDPTQTTATRPLAIQKDSTWYTYGWDLTKNITELYGSSGYIRILYTYTPYGSVTADGDVTQPIQWSSEFNDAELGLVYYNWRSYEPRYGIWCTLDIYYAKYYNRYAYAGNNPLHIIDIIGHYPVKISMNEVIIHKDYTYIKKENGIIIYGEETETLLYKWNDLYDIKYSGTTVEITHKNANCEQKPYIDIYLYHDRYRNENDPKSGYRDKQNRSVLEHEMEHAKIDIEEWNKFIAAADAQLGCYKSVDEYKMKHKKSIADLWIEYRENVNKRQEDFDRAAGSAGI